MKPTGTEFAHTARLLQLFDSALPNGGYAHSQGLEGLVQSGDIDDETSFLDFVRHDFFNTLTRTELPLFRLAYDAAARPEGPSLTELDELSRAVRPTGELREAASSTGRQTFHLYARLFTPTSAEATQLQRCGEYFSHHQAPIVLGCVARILHLRRAASLAAFATQLLNAMVLPTIKLLRFGPSQAQRLLLELNRPLAASVHASLVVERDDIGTQSPRWDIASAQHACAHSRLFIS